MFSRSKISRQKEILFLKKVFLALCMLFSNNKFHKNTDIFCNLNLDEEVHRGLTYCHLSLSFLSSFAYF